MINLHVNLSCDPMINPTSSFQKHLLAMGLLLLMLPALSQQWRKKPDVAITNVNIIDVESGSVQPGMDVLITADRILEVRETSTEGLETARVIDGSGKYLIPGLWDMHAHPDDPEMWRMKPNDIRQRFIDASIRTSWCHGNPRHGRVFKSDQDLEGKDGQCLTAKPSYLRSRATHWWTGSNVGWVHRDTQYQVSAPESR